MQTSGQDARVPPGVGDRRVITAHVGRPFTIRLWEDRTRGELWIPSFDTAALTLSGDEYLRIAGNNAVDNGQRMFEFQAVKPGTHQIVFEKRMGWKFTAEDRRVFEIDAADAAGE
jgi:predicted secreted protein